MPVPFVDLRAQHAPLTEAIERAFRDLVARGDFILGAAVERFETEYAGYIGARHAIGVGTGLAAIELALRAFEVGPGDEVITPANTFIATVLAILAVGARPVFVDVDAATYAIDPAAIGMREITETYERIGDVRCWAHDLERRWQEEESRTRVMVDERKAVETELTELGRHIAIGLAGLVGKDYGQAQCGLPVLTKVASAKDRRDHTRRARRLQRLRGGGVDAHLGLPR
jgi:hypothetical protein